MVSGEKMKGLCQKLSAILFIILSFNTQAIEDDFWGDLNESKYIDPVFTLYKGGNLDRYQEFYEKTVSQIRREYVSEATQLMEAGAAGIEAMIMIEAFDNRASARREEVFNYAIGETIANYVVSGLDELYQRHQTYNGKRILRFSHNRPRYEATLRFGPMISGSGVVYGILNITDRVSGDKLSVQSMAHISRARDLGKDLAKRLFHNVHRTRFPLTKPINHVDKKVFHLQRPITFSAPTSSRDQADQAKEYCSYDGMRLATIREMNSFFKRGYYGGGLDQLSYKTGWAAQKSDYDKTAMYLNGQHLRGIRSTNRMALNFVLHYICVEEVIR
tara:strand:+ start:1601 stop:2593 length:993 start_codon:yes stop_codon:yes gene_type:complete